MDDKIAKESKSLPNNFEPLLAIKNQLSKRYVSMVKDLLELKMYKTAGRLVERSNKIERYLEVYQ